MSAYVRAQAAIGDAERAQLFANVLYGVAGAAALGAVITHFIATGADAHVVVAPMITEDGAGAVARWSW